MRLSLDNGALTAEAWAQTEVQAKRKVALCVLLELGCPLDDTEDKPGRELHTSLWRHASLESSCLKSQ